MFALSGVLFVLLRYFLLEKHNKERERKNSDSCFPDQIKRIILFKQNDHIPGCKFFFFMMVEKNSLEIESHEYLEDGSWKDRRRNAHAWSRTTIMVQGQKSESFCFSK